MSADLDVAIVGAGISGLALAHRLRAAGRSVHVFESSPHVGGRMRTVRREGYVIDTGAEMVGTHGYDATWRLAGELGLSQADAPLLGTPLAMWREGVAHPGVGDLGGLIKGAGMSVSGRASLAKLMVGSGLRKRSYDVDRPDRTPLGSTTVRELARRYHPDVHDYLLQPMAGGFFGWDTERAAAGPLMSHLLAVGPTRTFRTWRHGMDTLARQIAARVDVSTGVTVHEVVAGERDATLVVDGAPLSARTVVLCVPAPVAAELHADAPDFVRACQFRPMVKVICLLDRPIEPIGGSPAWGIAVPSVENPAFAGLLIDHRKPGRAPAGRGLVTLFAGAAVADGLIDAPNEEVSDLLMSHAARYLPELASACRVSVVVRYRHGLPMPTAAALDEYRDFLHRPVSTVEYAGDWCVLRPSSEGAIRSAEMTADRLLVGSDSALAVFGG
ncbi:Protoporphyrinogen IX oxidase, aerobic, HemY [Alloactinosynnema sp. L-07]|uniref:protoporphyrinogen/coproporphyrinogen oxidase n=1 Tax=Alloactinosynnema sp. L-07 TaxID=1653480 RepID=UPI00065EF783|nr:NAD(P)/FAD-dependent oxidoreductase [Alloactinosynnema sp. L-07]CRK59489.1 Protoporphyrinogen IX oxidase, aerobic, HemY [Alloactinosynnema sp. L-07]